MIASAAVCPPTPLLAPELTGRDPVVPSLREACAAAVARLTQAASEVIAVVGERTGSKGRDSLPQRGANFHVGSTDLTK